MKIVHSSLAPAAIGPYSQATQSGGFVFCSGQIPLDPVTMELVPGGIEAQAHQVFQNLSEVAKAADSSLEKALKVSIFLKSLEDFSKVNTIYEGYFPGKPARVTLEVSALPKGALIEVDCILERNE